LRVDVDVTTMRHEQPDKYHRINKKKKNLFLDLYILKKRTKV